MNPCRPYQKLLALHAASALTGSEEAQVRDHLRDCAACGEYVDSLVSLAAEHRHAAADLPAFAAHPGFYQRIFRQVEGQGGSDWSRGASEARHWRVRIAWAVSALALVGCVLLVSRPRPSLELGNLSNNPVLPLADHKQTESRHIAYRLALNRSFEEFELLLSKAVPRHVAFSERSRPSRETLADPEL
jgi:hypothetical protein